MSFRVWAGMSLALAGDLSGPAHAECFETRVQAVSSLPVEAVWSQLERRVLISPDGLSTALWIYDKEFARLHVDPAGRERLAVFMAGLGDLGEVPSAFEIYGAKTCEFEVSFPAKGRVQLACAAGSSAEFACPVLLLEVADGRIERH